MFLVICFSEQLFSWPHMNSRKIYLELVQFWNICRILFLYTIIPFMRIIKVKIIDRYSISSNIYNIAAVVQSCSVKKVLWEISQNSQENTCSRACFLIKLHAETCNFIKKETRSQIFSCDFCAISKNTFLHRTPLVAAYESILVLTFFFPFVKC